MIADSFSQQEFIDRETQTIRFRSDQRQRLIELVNLLAQSELFLSHIRDEVIEMIRLMPVELDEDHRIRGDMFNLFLPTGMDLPIFAEREAASNTNESQLAEVIQQSLFQSVSKTVSLPRQGKNAKALDTMPGFNCKDVPEDLCCPLSGEIMDDPVYDPEHTQYKYERAWIETAIEKKAEHPHIRSLLTKNKLVSDDQLKAKIKLFMDGINSAAAPPNP